ncbi:MAG: hypothetical protein NDJ89_15485 [Oligoflexia bacterium]|nr:hypothetical protein [Oligoflexia bacterium]
MKAKLLAACALLGLLSWGCGTEIGNPSNADPAAANFSGTRAEALLNALCSKLNECFPALSFNDCRAGILASTTIDTELGLPANYGAYQTVVNAESASALTASASAANACVAAVAALACADPLVTSAYNGSTPTDFSNIANLLPGGNGSCPEVYR